MEPASAFQQMSKSERAKQSRGRFIARQIYRFMRDIRIETSSVFKQSVWNPKRTNPDISESGLRFLNISQVW